MFNKKFNKKRVNPSQYLPFMHETKYDDIKVSAQMEDTFRMEFLFELIAGILIGFSPKSRIEKNMETLKKEEWFLFLWNDYRYQHILFHSNKVKRILRNNQRVENLLTHSQEQERFIDMVKQEHEDYVRLS